jgi:hypothetical protein
MSRDVCHGRAPVRSKFSMQICQGGCVTARTVVNVGRTFAALIYGRSTRHVRTSDVTYRTLPILTGR